MPKKTSRKELEKTFDKDLVFKQAYQELDRLSWSVEELRNYEQVEKYRATYQAALDQKMDEGIEKGREMALNLRNLNVAISAISKSKWAIRRRDKIPLKT